MSKILSSKVSEEKRDKGLRQGGYSFVILRQNIQRILKIVSPNHGLCRRLCQEAVQSPEVAVITISHQEFNLLEGGEKKDGLTTPLCVEDLWRVVEYPASLSDWPDWQNWRRNRLLGER